MPSPPTIASTSRPRILSLTSAVPLWMMVASATAALATTTMARARPADPPSAAKGTTGATGVSGTTAAPLSLADTSKARLARLFALLATRAVHKDELALADIELGQILAEFAVELAPDDVLTWRALLGVLSIADPADPRNDALRRAAIERIAKLDPGDEVIRLRRILDAVEGSETAETRIETYRKLLDTKNLAAIGKPVAARLALDLALLLQRTGDQAGFEKWLGEAVTLDPSFPAATSMAAGYFRFAAPDASREAELLIAAVMANPLDPMAIRALASMLLDHGAYVGAARFHGLIAEMVKTDFPVTSYDRLLGDEALALIGAGKPAEAAELARRRKLQLDAYWRNELGKADPSLLADQARLRSERFPVPSALLAVRLAALRAAGDDATLPSAINDLYFSLDSEAERIAKEGSDPKASADIRERLRDELAASLLQGALLSFWLGEDAEHGKTYLDKSNAVRPLQQEAQARFAAWNDLRSGKAAEALAVFEKYAEGEPASRMGKAIALGALRRTRDAASEYLALWRETPGTVLGVDAKRRLEALLGARVPVEEAARKLEATAAQVPASFDRLFTVDGRPLTLRVRFAGHPANVFESVPMKLEVMNTSPFPLSIDTLGPIRDLVSLQAQVTIAGQANVVDIPYLVIPINRAFTIAPRSTLTVPFDLAYSDVGTALSQCAAQGCSVMARCIVNWEVVVGGFRPGAMGDRADSDLLRIDGVRLSDEWLASALERAAHPSTADDGATIAALIGFATRAQLTPDSISEPRRAELEKAWSILAASLPHFDPFTQAWLLVVLPDTIPPLVPALEAVRGSDDKLVRLAYLVRRSEQSGDAVIETATKSTDPEIARYGRVVKEMMLHEEELVRRDFALGTSGKTREQPGGTAPEAPKPSESPKPSPNPTEPPKLPNADPAKP